MNSFGGIQVTYNGYINDNGNQSVQLNIRLGFNGKLRRNSRKNFLYLST